MHKIKERCSIMFKVFEEITNCLLTYFVTHRQYFHLIVNKMYVFLGIIYAIYELFNLTN